MKCWACKKDTMKMRRDGRFWKCTDPDCGATENVRGHSDTETPPIDKR